MVTSLTRVSPHVRKINMMKKMFIRRRRTT
ncbi:hypothetical protein LINPERPRIM_LOCUS33022 [Linum perenne]